MSMQEGEAPELGNETITPPPLNERPVDGPGSGRSKLRGQLEQGFEDTRRKPPQEEQPRRRGQPSSSQVQEPDEAPAEGEETQPVQAQEITTKPPEGWVKEAKATWAQLPEAARNAVLKREEDMAKGVAELKQRQVEIDNVLAPRMDYIRRFGHTPATAVHQLFSWFEALSNNPVVAFPALAQSCNFDLRQLFQPQGQGQPGQQGQPQPNGQPEQGQQPEPWRQAIDQLNNAWSQRFGSLQQNFQHQNYQKTEEILGNWSKDKPHFDEVRQMMARLISPTLDAQGNVTAPAAIQPLQNGMADLDKAYEYAIWAVPEVRSKIMAAQQASEAEKQRQQKETEKKAQQDAANKARRAAGSLSSGAPGQPVEQPKKKFGKSVKDSLKDAMEELRS